jgi:hypothetical protein
MQTELRGFYWRSRVNSFGISRAQPWPESLDREITRQEEAVMRRVAHAALVLLFVPLFGVAQSSQHDWGNLKELHPGQKIEVVDKSMKSFGGHFDSVSEEAITLQVGKSQQTIERAKVVRVSVRDTSHRKRNMLIGTAVGVGAGLAIAIPVGLLCSNEGNCGSSTAGAAVAVAGLGAAGAGIGAIPGNRTVYRAAK